VLSNYFAWVGWFSSAFPPYSYFGDELIPGVWVSITRKSETNKTGGSPPSLKTSIETRKDAKGISTQLKTYTFIVTSSLGKEQSSKEQLKYPRPSGELHHIHFNPGNYWP